MERIWDYNVTSTSLTILFPDGLTYITTNRTSLVSTFMSEIGLILDGNSEETLDARLHEWAEYLLEVGAKKRL